MPSRVVANNAAKYTREETKEVTAAEVAAPSIVISGAPDDKKTKDDHLFLPVAPIRDCYIPFPLSVVYSRNAPEKGDPTPQGRAAPGTPTGSADLGSKAEPFENVGAGSVALQNSEGVMNTCIDPVKLL